MSRASGGTYTLPAGNPVVTGSVISSTWANTTLSDIATALTDSLSRSGLGSMTAPLQFTDGTIGAPSITFGTETTLGLYRAGASDTRFAVGGVDVFRFTAAGATALAFIPNSNTVPTNGLYLPAANTIGLASNSTLRGSVNATGNWVFAAPTAGTAVVINALATGRTLQLKPADSSSIGMELLDPGANATSLRLNTTNTTATVQVANALSSLLLAVNNGTAVTIVPNGNITTAAPSAGVALTIGGLANTEMVRLSFPTSGSTGAYQTFFDSTNTLIRGYIGSGATLFSGAAITDFGLASGASGVLRFSANSGTNTHMMITSAGRVQIVDSANALFNAGFLELPVNTQNVAYTTVLADSGKCIYHTDGTARTYTIDSNANVAYPIGTVIVFSNDASGAVNVTIAITADTLSFSPTGATGSRTLAQFGRATAHKVAATRWIISGTGLS